MKRTILLMAVLVALWTLVNTTAAEALPLLLPILGAIGVTGAAATILGNIIIIGISLGVSLLLSPQRPANSQADNGVQIDIRVDALVPQSLIVGRAVLGGSRIYIESYGDNNTNVIEFIALADHPCEGLVQVFVEGQVASLTDTLTDRGSTIDGYDGNLAGKFWDGTQVAADPYAVAALSGHPERPWTANHIGRRRTLWRSHYIYNREKVTGPLPWKFVVDGIKLYDPRLDSTVGGSGPQRFDDLSTHAFTKNLAVICYNILRGIRVLDESNLPYHFYGLENTPAENLPLDNWFAAMNEADVEVDKDIGTEPQFHGGLEIPVETEPLETIRQIMNATGGKFVENGGIYKLYLGAPGLPVASFNDLSLPSNLAEAFKPIVTLDDQVTYIEGSYTSEDDGWITKAAPAAVNTSLETELGKRIPASLDAPMVQSGFHMQRLFEQLLNRAIRERRHQVTLPPAFFGVEAGDVLSYTSDRNSYTNKLFEALGAEISANLSTSLDILEVDPADYDPPAAFVPLVPASLVTDRPAPKVVAGFAVEGFVHEGAQGHRPAIKLSWDDPLDDDLIRVKYRIRVAADPTNEVPGDAGEPTALAAIILGVLSNTAYEVSARFESYNGFATEWSLWLPVTTPDVGVSTSELDAQVQAWLQQLDVTRQAALALVLDDLNARLTALGHTTSGLVALLNERVEGSIVNYIGDANANITEVRTVAEGLADLFLSVFVGDEVSSGNALMRFTAGAGPGGVGASIKLEVRALAADILKEAGLEIYAVADADGGESGVILTGEKVLVQPPSGDPLNALLIGLQDTPRNAPITSEGGNVIRADLTGRQQRHKTILNGNAEMRAPIGITSMDYTHALEQNGTGGWTTTFSNEFLPPHPSGMSELPGAISLIKCSVQSINPIEILAEFSGTSYTRTPSISIRADLETIRISGSGANLGFDISSLDFIPGSLLVLTAYGANWFDGGAGTLPTIGDGAMSGWTPIISHGESVGGANPYATRISAWWKIADGNEDAADLVPFSLGGTTSRDTYFAYGITAFNTLGGTIQPDPSPTADSDPDGNALSMQTIQTGDYAAPDIAVSFAVRTLKDSSPVAPNQTFASETPDIDRSFHGPNPSITLIEARLKVKVFSASPNDVTTSLSAQSSPHTRHALLSFALYLG